MLSHPLTIVERPNRIIVATGRTEVHLARTNGGILEIRDAQTGKTHCSAADCPERARLFRIVAVRRLQRGRAADAHAQQNVVWNCTADGVTITYSALTFEGQSTDCAAVVRIEAGEDGELCFSLSVENREDDAIHEIQFPMLSGWRNRDGAWPIELTGGAKWKSKVGQLPKFGFPAYCQWYQQVSVDYPGSVMYMPWLDFSGADGGVSLINYMAKPYAGGIGGINLAGHEKGSLECYWWRHYPLIKKGSRWVSPSIGVSVHDGNWHRTADRYYDWFRSNIGVTMEQPQALRTSIGFQNIILRNFDGTRENEVESLVEHARVGRRYGVRHLSVWDSLSLGNYAIYDPDVDLLDYPPEERKRLREAIAQVKQEGVTVSALVNFRHINVRSKLYARYKSEAAFCMDGSEWRENWCGCVRTSAIFTKHMGLNCILLSPRSPQTRLRVDAILNKYLDLGYTALFYDQPFLYFLDYNHMGQEGRPDDASSAWYDTVAHARSRLRATDAEAYIIGEQFDIFSASRAVDLHMEWNFTNSGVEDLARVLYACPHALLSYVIDYTTSGETQASHAFAAGLLLCITIDGGEANLGKRPDLAAHIAQLAALREKCAQRVAYGRFRHMEGLTLEGDAGVVAYAYDSPMGPAVVMAAGETGGKARVGIDLSRFQTPAGRERNKLFRLSGEALEVGDENLIECAFAPNEVAVWYC